MRKRCAATPPANHYAFIDAQNVTRAFLFLGYLQRNEPLYQALRGDGYELIFKPVVEQKDGVVKGNVDAELVLHAMIELPNYDKAVIVTSDGDFYCLVEYLLRQGKLEKLLIPNRKRFSSLYRKLMPHMHFMNDLQGKLAYRGQ